ncbi:MAG TPA: glycosyltransferase family 4 protein [Chthoniobacterales bacterium]|nr:glycosyltransferase family 4 protein [Chthoniobacterales bacterium]
MLRVAYLFERFPSFGQTFCYREVAELERQGADVTVFSIRRPTGEPPQDWNEALVGRVHYLPDENALAKEVEGAAADELPPEAVRALKEWGRNSDFLRLYQAAYVGLRLRELGIQRVHAHFAGMAARTVYWIRQFFGIDYSITAHANDIFAPRDFVVSLEKIIARAAAVVTVSDFSADHLRRQFPAHASRVHRVYNGIEASQFPQARFDSEPPLVVGVGRLIEKKGFADLVSACRFLVERRIAVRCAIIGEGPLHESLASHIAHSQLERVVELLGPQSQAQLVERLAAATVFVLPCAVEQGGGMDNLPTVIMEAMAAGLPVISTRIGGVPEMVQPGVNGELVPPGDSLALADAIERIITNRESARRLGAAGRALAAEKFGIEKNIRSLATILAGESVAALQANNVL